MAKRAKRAYNVNPRQDRNFPKYSNFKNPRGNQRYYSNNVIDFPNSPQKKHLEIIPRNINQENLVAALEDQNKCIVFATGPAGTGKTYLCMLHAVKQLRSGNINKIIICRPNIAVDDKDIGFLPGDILSKMGPWIKPCTEILSEFYDKKQIEHMLQEEIVEVLPIAFCRGRTFKNCVVILDEAQGTTRNSLLSMLTRIGENCRILVTGDVEQSDRGSDNGLSDFILRFSRRNCPNISLIEFAAKDVQRHPVIIDILKLYEA